jgi:hypothetical protein
VRRQLQGDELLTSIAVYVRVSKSRSSKGRGLETYLDTERVRFLRAAPEGILQGVRDGRKAPLGLNFLRFLRTAKTIAK